jgi:hypothetical protein
VALLANGKKPNEIGELISDPILIEIPAPRKIRDIIHGEIIDIDSFGNLIINIPREMLPDEPKVMLKEMSIPMCNTFADVKPGYPLSYVGSLGFLEIAINLGRAERYFGVGIGDKIKVAL